MPPFYFCLDGLPMAWARPAQGRSRSGAVLRIPDKKREAHKAHLAMAALDAWGPAPPLFGPIKLFVAAIFPITPGWPAALRAAAMAGELAFDAKPDFDNIIKQVADALPFIAWVDDCQISDGRCQMRYGRAPRTECWIAPASPESLETPATAQRRKKWHAGGYDAAIIGSLGGASRLPRVLDATRKRASAGSLL